MKISTKLISYVFALAIFVLASVIYFHPILEGQKLQQSDITQFRGMVKKSMTIDQTKIQNPIGLEPLLAECHRIKLVPITPMIW